MLCPKCKFEDSKVVDSRPLNSDSSIRRRRECLSCKFRFTTYEYIQISPIMVIKKSGGREEYSRKKIEKSLHLAFNKRPISEEIIQNTINEIEDQINVSLSSRPITCENGSGSVWNYILNCFYKTLEKMFCWHFDYYPATFLL